jgi:hypothetical protein
LADWNWTAIGAVGEILGAVAVVVTLIYLAGQLRQNALQIRLASAQTAGTNYSSSIIGVLSDPEKLDIFRRGLKSVVNLSPDEQARFHAAMLGFHTSFEHNLRLYRAGVIEQSLFDSWARDWVQVLKCTGAAQWWSLFSGSMDVELRSYVEELVQKSDSKPLNEVAPFLRLEGDGDGA